MEKLTLTQAEEQIMQIIWKLEKCYVREIIMRLPDPKPAYNTVSTIVRILEAKKFVWHEGEGKTHLYYPIVKKESYNSSYLNTFMQKYFGGSFANLASFFVKQNNIDLQTFEEMMKIAEDEAKTNEEITKEKEENKKDKKHKKEGEKEDKNKKK